MSERARENVLVLVLDEEPDLHALRRELSNGRELSVRLVAPAHVGPLHWYATDEDADHAAAKDRLRDAERVLAPADVETASGDLDPVLAVEDALSEFHADRIVVVGEEDTALHESLRRFDVPVERLGGPPVRVSGGEIREQGRAIQSGRSNLTPYAVFAGAMIVLGIVVAIGFLIAALVLWV